MQSPDSTPRPQTTPDREAELASQRIKSTRIAIALMIPLMIYVAYQVFTKRPVHERTETQFGRVDSGEAGADRPRDVSETSAGIKFDPNTATWSELTVLPGIGEVMAKRIVAYREEHARDGQPVFRCASDLDKVPGIGPKTVEKIMPHLTIPPECDQGAAAAHP